MEITEMIENKEQALSTLKELKILLKDKELCLQKIEEIENYLNKPISMLDLLGWKSNEVYEKDFVEYNLKGEVYRTINKKYYVKDNKLCIVPRYPDYISSIFDMNEINDLKVYAKKVETPRFYLKRENSGAERGFSKYFNYNPFSGRMYFDNEYFYESKQTIFTEEEIKDIEEKYKVDLSYLERVPASV